LDNFCSKYFVFIAISQAIYSFKNATSKNRFSTFDITDNNEEIDPLNTRFSGNQSNSLNVNNSEIDNLIYGNTKEQDNRFCPYCGIKLGNDFEFCNKCGRKLPE